MKRIEVIGEIAGAARDELIVCNIGFRSTR